MKVVVNPGHVWSPAWVFCGIGRQHIYAMYTWAYV